MATTIIQSLSSMLRETIAQGADESLPKLDTVFKTIMGSSRGVEARDTMNGIGRAWQVQHRFLAGEGGSHAWRDPSGGNVALAGGPDVHPFQIWGQNAMQRWQSPNEISTPHYGAMTITLKAGYGNMLIPLHLKRINKLNAAVTDLIADIGRSEAKRVAAAMVHAFWKTGSNNAIGGFTTTGATSITSTPIEVTLTEGRVRSFFPGLAVQVFVASDGSAPVGLTINEPVWIRNCDYISKTIELFRRPGAGAITLAASTDYIILPYDGTSSAASDSISPSGLEDWLKDGTETDPTIYGIDVTNYPQYKSIKNVGLSGACDGSTLNKYIGGFEDGFGMELDTLIMTWGTLLSMQDSISTGTSIVRYDLQGEAQQLKYGFLPFAYLFNGRMFKIYISANCPIGTIYVLKTGDNNIRKYTPPTLDKATRKSGYPTEVEFVGRVLGYSDDFIPVHSNDAPSDFLQCPFLHWIEFAPRMIQGIKLGTFDENIYDGS